MPPSTMPRCEILKNMILLHCCSLTGSMGETDMEQLWATESAAVDCVGMAIVETVKEMTRRLKWAAQDARAKGSSIGGCHAEEHEEYSWSICQEQLVPILGYDRARAIWSTCHRCSWHIQNKAQCYEDDAEADRLWMQHYAQRMGFDDSPLVSKNSLVLNLCSSLCRSWSADSDVDSASLSNENLPRQAAFLIADLEARECLNEAVVDTIIEMTREIRRSCSLNRLADRKQPLRFINNLLQDAGGKSRAALDAARVICNERLKPLVGEKAEEVFHTSFSCAWQEQNQRDYHTAVGGKLTGARAGYLTDAKQNKRNMIEHAALMGFDG